jgi:hypothetical protein
LDKQKIIRINLKIPKLDIKLPILMISKRRLKNFDHENLKIDQKFGYLYEVVKFLDDDING